MRSSTQKREPTFLYIGVARAGSGWLFECLREHPDIFAPAAKDINYFNYYHHKGPDWYRSYFKKVAQENAVGEVSHDYYLFRETAERIHAMTPRVKLICCLREPVDKMLSGLRFSRRFHGGKAAPETFLTEFGKEPGERDLAFDLDSNLNIFTLRYYEKLKPFYDRFPRENILVLFYDELKADPGAFIRRVYDFVGVDPGFIPGSLHRKINSASRARIPAVGFLAYFGAQVFRRMGLAHILGSIKKNRFFRALLYTRKGEMASLDPESISRIREYCARDHERLVELIGRALPETWPRAGESPPP